METGFNSRHAMPVWTVLRLTITVQRTYVCLANASNIIRVVGHLQVSYTCTDVFHGLPTAARTIISFRIRKKIFFFFRHSLKWICRKQVNIEGLKEKEDYYSVIAVLVNIHKLRWTNKIKSVLKTKFILRKIKRSKISLKSRKKSHFSDIIVNDNFSSPI